MLKSRCWKLIATYSPYIFSLAFIIKIRVFSNPKMNSVGPEPHWYITQPVVFTTSSLLEAYRNLFTSTFFSRLYIV